MPPSILLYRTILLFLCLFLPLIALKEKNSSFATCFCVQTTRIKDITRENRKRKVEEISFLLFFYIADRFVYLLDQRLDQFHIIRYIFIPTYLHMIGAVCVMIKHCFSIVYCHSHRDTFSSNGILISRYTALRSVESVSSLKTQRAFN